MNEIKEIPEAKSLRWLANMFPFTENPQDEEDKNKCEEIMEKNRKLLEESEVE